MQKKKTKKFALALAVVMAVTSLSTTLALADPLVPEGTPPGNAAITAATHPEEMNVQHTVYAIGTKTFYAIESKGAKYRVRFGDTVKDAAFAGMAVEAKAVPSAYIDGSPYNKTGLHYGIYCTYSETTDAATGAVTGVFTPHFVDLGECAKGAGAYFYYHGTSDGATVSDEVDTATNEDPTMSTDFYLHAENGIDPDGPSTEKTVTGSSEDSRVEYEVVLSSKQKYQLKATVPMYVCMYGYRGDGRVVTPTSDAYQLKNYSTMSRDDKATITSIVKVTHMSKIYDANHSNEKLYSIGYKAGEGYTYWYSKPDTAPAGYDGYYVFGEKQLAIDPVTGNEVLSYANDVTASGECYVICLPNGQWLFKTAGALDGDALRESVTKIDPMFPLKNNLYIEYVQKNMKAESTRHVDFGKDITVGMSKSTEAIVSKEEDIPILVTDLQAEPATWRLMPVSEASLQRGDIAMSLTPVRTNGEFSVSLKDNTAIDLSAFSAQTDITARGWYIGELGTLPLQATARIAGGNVNAAGCTNVVKVSYTVVPVMDDTEIMTVTRNLN